MSEKIWSDDAWKDYLYWQTQDKKTLKRINQLIKDIERKAFSFALMLADGNHSKKSYLDNS